MPIYKGATKVTPRRGGTALSRVYKGDKLVWQAGPSFPPFADSKTVPTVVCTRYQWTQGPSISLPESGVYRVEVSVNWQTSAPAGQQMRLFLVGGGGSLNHSPGFGVTNLVREGGGNGSLRIDFFSNREPAAERTVTGGHFSVTRIG